MGNVWGLLTGNEREEACRGLEMFCIVIYLVVMWFRM